MMSPEDVEFNNRLNALVKSVHWDTMVEVVEDTAAAMNMVDGLSTTEELWYRKGFIAALRGVVAIPATLGEADAPPDDGKNTLELVH